MVTVMRTESEILISLLERSRDGQAIQECDDETATLLSQLGAVRNIEGGWVLTRETRIQIAMRAAAAGVDIERVVKAMDWKDFEGLVAAILEMNEFDCVESFRQRGNELRRGMEIDVIGVRDWTIVTVDAKMWGIRSGKRSALREAAERQLQRSVRLASELSSLRRRLRSLKPGQYRVLPVLVTWLVEDVVIHEGVPIVPVFKLNSFLLNIPMYEDLLHFVQGRLD